jgi:hypothetical protein
MKEFYASGDVLHENVEMTRLRLNQVSIPRRKSVHTYNFLTTMLYTAADFFTIFLSILFSYKLYHLLGIGQKVVYQGSDIISGTVIVSLSGIFILFLF